MSKRRFGDRKDAKLIRNLDSLHFIMPLIYPNRFDNEAFISERLDLTKLNEYLEKKNAGDPEYKYNLFQVIVTAVLRTMVLRPKMNRFIANKNYYQRNEVTAAFIVKKIFADNGAEGMAIIKGGEDANIDTIHDDIYKKVSKARNEDSCGSTEDSMNFFTKIPHFISKAIISFICVLDRHGKVPQSLIAEDPYYQSVMLTNLGSIKLHSGYHHLTNWGTNSVFVIVGERKKRPFYDDDGNMTLRDSVDLGLTVDERIGDGYYFSKTVRILKKLIENPELLDEPMSKEVEV